MDLKPQDLTESEESAVLVYHKLIEATKYLYGIWKYFGDSQDENLLNVSLIKQLKSKNLFGITLVTGHKNQNQGPRLHSLIDKPNRHQGSRSSQSLRFKNWQSRKYRPPRQGRHRSNQCHWSEWKCRFSYKLHKLAVRFFRCNKLE